MQLKHNNNNVIQLINNIVSAGMLKALVYSLINSDTNENSNIILPRMNRLKAFKNASDSIRAAVTLYRFINYVKLYDNNILLNTFLQDNTLEEILLNIFDSLPPIPMLTKLNDCSEILLLPNINTIIQSQNIVQASKTIISKETLV